MAQEAANLAAAIEQEPIFDDQPTGSIGDIAVASSNPNVIYVGSGEGLQRPDLSTGDGIYRSNDAGRTWQHLGLREAQQIGAILVDPKDPNLVYVAALGHPYGANEERGVFRSRDGGNSWQKVLYRDENTGAIALAMHQPSGCCHEETPIYLASWARGPVVWTIRASGARIHTAPVVALVRSVEKET